MKSGRYAKHALKRLLGRPDPAWPLAAFEDRVKRETWRNRAKIIAEAEAGLSDGKKFESDEAYAASTDPLAVQGHGLKTGVEAAFRNKFSGRTAERVLFHVPDQIFSPAGYSLFTNFKEAFDFIGVPAEELGWNEPVESKLESFKPTIFLTSDSKAYLDRIDWQAINERKRSNPLKVGLTASLEEYGNSLLPDRLRWAKANDIDFYYSFRDPGYVNSRKEYRPFFDSGYKILYLPFGAHISRYFPVAGFERDLDYAYLASKQSSKPATAAFLSPIMSKYAGFLDGPGWEHVKDFSFNRDRDRYIYARAKAGLNLHLPEQIEWACEINERAYQLAACGVPQVTDRAKLLDKIFGADSLFVADTAAEYLAHFENIIHNPEIGVERALTAQKEVFARHTTYHRAASFIEQLKSL